jgi:hypothetical protein
MQGIDLEQCLSQRNGFIAIDEDMGRVESKSHTLIGQANQLAKRTDCKGRCNADNHFPASSQLSRYFHQISNEHVALHNA